MLASVFSCSVIGLDGVVIEVEVDTSQGLPTTIIVGLPDAAVQESRERVQTAIRNSGYSFPRKRITVNLAPASVRKAGPAFDLPIALGILIASGVLSADIMVGAMAVGELSLDGSVRHVRGILSMAATAHAEGFKRIFVPHVDANEAALISELEVIPVASLASLLLGLNGKSTLLSQPRMQLEDVTKGIIENDFQEIKGQEHVKRALEVAAAGRHNILLTGPPGAGKTLLARSIPTILPRMSIAESLEITRIYSIADQLPKNTPLIQTRPFRSPHHTISHAGLVGGGNWPQPGEISLAHCGVLFLDELPEFSPRVLEVMRQPIEEGIVTISRAQGSLTFPARFQLIAAMNPCPCGFYSDPITACKCSSSVVTRYQKRISGPLMDRIDIHIEVPRVDYRKLSEGRLGEPSSNIQMRVEQARASQRMRFENQGLLANADMRLAEVRKYCQLDIKSQSLMHTAMQQMHLSARAYHRVLKLARTIADLSEAEHISSIHLAEALQYRSKNAQI